MVYSTRLERRVEITRLFRLDSFKNTYSSFLGKSNFTKGDDFPCSYATRINVFERTSTLFVSWPKDRAAILRIRIKYWWPAWYRLMRILWQLNLLRATERRFVSRVGQNEGQRRRSHPDRSSRFSPGNLGMKRIEGCLITTLDVPQIAESSYLLRFSLYLSIPRCSLRCPCSDRYDEPCRWGRHLFRDILS